MYSSIHKFKIIKYFDIKCQPPPALRIIQVNWYFFSQNMIKCITYEVSRGNPIILTCGDIFRDNLRIFLVALSANIGVCTSFQTELHGIMFAMEYANTKNWRNLRLETDLMMFIRAFFNVDIVP